MSFSNNQISQMVKDVLFDNISSSIICVLNKTNKYDEIAKKTPNRSAIKTKQETLKQFEKVYEILKTREKIFEQFNANSLDEYNNQNNNAPLEKIALIVEGFALLKDVLNYHKNNNRKYTPAFKMKEICMNGSKHGIHFVTINTQGDTCDEEEIVVKKKRSSKVNDKYQTLLEKF